MTTFGHMRWVRVPGSECGEEGPARSGASAPRPGCGPAPGAGLLSFHQPQRSQHPLPAISRDSSWNPFPRRPRGETLSGPLLSAGPGDRRKGQGALYSSLEVQRDILKFSLVDASAMYSFFCKSELGNLATKVASYFQGGPPQTPHFAFSGWDCTFRTIFRTKRL